MLIMIFAALLTATVLVLLFSPIMKVPDAPARPYAIGAMVALPILALGGYLLLGQPDVPSAAALFEKDGPRAERRTMIKEELAVMRELSAHPNDPQKLLDLGMLRLKTGRMGEALAAFEQAHALAPDDHIIADRLGGTHYAIGLMMIMQKSNTPDEVFEEFDKALAVAPPEASYRDQLVKQHESFRLMAEQMRQMRAQMHKGEE